MATIVDDLANKSHAEKIAVALDGKRSGNGWLCHCPCSGHEDKHPSFRVSEGHTVPVLVRCFAGCSQPDCINALKARNLWPQAARRGCSLEELAFAKRLPEALLKEAGLSDADYFGTPAIKFQYHTRDGKPGPIRYRIALDGTDDFRWAKGNRAILYGLDRLERGAHIILVEGESDCLTCWHHDYPALGIPGAPNWREDRDAPHVAGFDRIYVVIEKGSDGKPDPGGQAVLRWLSRSEIRHRALLIDLGEFKDPSSLYINDPKGFKEAFDRCLYEALAWTESEYAKSPPSTPPTRGFPDTDLANARRIARACRDRLRHTPERGWFAFDGKRWKADKRRALGLGKDTLEGVYDEIKGASNREQMYRWAQKSQMAERISSALKLAAAEPEFMASYNDFDTDPWLLCCANGTLDLRTGTLQYHQPENLISRLSPVNYNAQAHCPIWLHYLKQVMPDSVMRDYLQRAAGYSLTGQTGERCLFFAYGEGANGKSVFLETLARIAGEYSTATRIETFTLTRNDRIPNDIARLAGTRVVTVSETNDGQRLNESLVKDMTGGDMITARFLHCEFFDFRPEFKLWIRGNHKPVIRGTDQAIWDRIHLIPFNVRIGDDQQDHELGNKLAGELPGILAWAVRGCLDWQALGLKRPEVVRKATEAYRKEENIIEQFLKACTTEEVNFTVGATLLYREYKKWCDIGHSRPVSQTAFGKEIAKKYEREKGEKLVFYVGLGLLSG